MGALVTVMVSPHLKEGCDVTQDAAAAFSPGAVDHRCQCPPLGSCYLTHHMEAIMTNTATESTSAPLLGSVDAQLDLLLSVILGINDEHESNSVGVILVTAGGVISGEASTRTAWTKGQIERLNRNGSEGAKFLGDVLRIVDERAADDDESDEEPIAMRRYINVKNARVSAGGTTTDYEWLRVDMRQVIAWELGSHNQPEAS